ncbi:hypothetical protein B0H10DRAFT_1645136, partial [Mycena sp. CBHHK59/15]
LDMPIRVPRRLPRFFVGNIRSLAFIQHYDRLLNKCRVTDEKERCKCVLEYCSTDVQNFIQSSEYFIKNNWTQLHKEILKFYDAELATQKYKPSDVVAYTLKSKNRPCYNLTQWKKYFTKYHSIAGGPLQQGHLNKENYQVYFWLGIHPTLRQILENRILQQNPWRNGEDEYTFKEISNAAEWYFRRNKSEALILNASEYGINVDEEYLGEESEEESASSEDSDSDYEEFRRKKKLREKRKKNKIKMKLAAKKKETSGRMKYSGNEEEITSLIRKLNAMKIDDPEYAPVYYKVMVIDQSGTAAKCV